MSQIENPRNSTFITALTADQADWSLFGITLSREPNARETLESWFPSWVDFYDETVLASIKHSSVERYSIPLILRKSEGLNTFLEQHRPPTLFFAPQEISGVLTPESDIVVNRKSHEGQLGLWVFSLNPKKQEADSPSLKQTITLTTIEKPGRYALLEPYLAVGFRASYDDSNVIFYPSIKRTWDTSPRDTLDKEMIKFLGLKEQKIEQRLGYKVIKEEARSKTIDRGVLIDSQPFYVNPIEISLK